MATISRYATPAGTTGWEVRYRKPDRSTTRKRGFKTKAAASAFAATVEVSKMDGSYVSPTLGRVTVADVGCEWLQRKEVAMKPSSYKSVETAWRVHVKPVWGDVRVSDIDLPRVESWVTGMCRESGATVVLRNYGVLASILDDAVKQKRLARNFARTPDNLPQKQRKAHTYLAHEEVAALAHAADDRRVIVLVLAYCGLRWGELIALRVRHLDLLRKRISVEENVVQVNMKMHPGTPKNGDARSVPIPKFLVEELAKVCEGKSRDDLLFPGPQGFLRRPVSHSGWFAKAVEKSGVPKLSVHDLRHTAASLAVSVGANVKAVQRMLGHKSATMTLDVYSDLFDSDLDAVAERLDAAAGIHFMSGPTEVDGDQLADANRVPASRLRA